MRNRNLIVWGTPEDFFRDRRFKGATKFKVEDLKLSDLEVHFTQGYCYHLAQYLHELTGLPIYNINDGHAVVGNGKRFLDITGWMNRKELVDKWGSMVYVVDDPATEFKDWGAFLYDGCELSPMKMRYIARKVVDTYGP